MERQVKAASYEVKAVFFHEQMKGDEREGEPLMCSSTLSGDLWTTLWSPFGSMGRKTSNKTTTQSSQRFLLFIFSQTVFLQHFFKGTCFCTWKPCFREKCTSLTFYGPEHFWVWPSHSPADEAVLRNYSALWVLNRTLAALDGNPTQGLGWQPQSFEAPRARPGLYTPCIFSWDSGFLLKYLFSWTWRNFFFFLNFSRGPDSIFLHCCD